ncbi:MAG: hypothetical protein HY722_10535 [Planctomycetes bacterium]|nr:hypothetical protein [Planctomycetota bacterium]
MPTPTRHRTNQPGRVRLKSRIARAFWDRGSDATKGIARVVTQNVADGTELRLEVAPPGGKALRTLTATVSGNAASVDVPFDFQDAELSGSPPRFAFTATIEKYGLKVGSRNLWVVPPALRDARWERARAAYGEAVGFEVASERIPDGTPVEISIVDAGHPDEEPVASLQAPVSGGRAKGSFVYRYTVSTDPVPRRLVFTARAAGLEAPDAKSGELELTEVLELRLLAPDGKPALKRTKQPDGTFQEEPHQVEVTDAAGAKKTARPDAEGKVRIEEVAAGAFKVQVAGEAWIYAAAKDDTTDPGTEVKGHTAVAGLVVGVVAKLPLGARIEKLGLERAVIRTLFPTRAGGMLVFQADKEARLSLRRPDPLTAVKAESHASGCFGFRARFRTKKAPEVPIAGKERLQYEVPPDQHGWYFLMVEGGAGQPLSATAYEEGWIQDQDAKTGDKGVPLIPFNFWYWPVKYRASEWSQTGCSSPHAWEGAGAVLRKYGQAHGLTPGELAAWWEAGGKPAEDKAKKDGEPAMVTEAAASRYEDQGDGHFRPKQPGWAGHCHNNAPSTVYFEEPARGGASHNGQSFALAELEFLLGEATGNIKEVTVGWSPNAPFFAWGQVPMVVTRRKDGRKAKGYMNAGGNQNLWRLVKPSDFPDGEEAPPEADIAARLRPILKEVLASQFEPKDGTWRGADLDLPAADGQPGNVRFASGDAYHQELSGPDLDQVVDDALSGQSLQDWWRAFGRAAASFHRTLAERVRIQGEPLYQDIRAQQDSRGSAFEVWFTILYYYRAHLVEDPGSGDELDVWAFTECYYLVDNVNFMGTHVADVQDQGRVLPDKGRNWRRQMLARLNYGADGKVADNPRNRWAAVLYAGDSVLDRAHEGGYVRDTVVAAARKDPATLAGARALWVPATLWKIDDPTTSRPGGDDFGLGNPYVDKRALQSKLLRLRHRYCKGGFATYCTHGSP